MKITKLVNITIEVKDKNQKVCNQLCPYLLFTDYGDTCLLRPKTQVVLQRGYAGGPETAALLRTPYCLELIGTMPKEKEDWYEQVDKNLSAVEEIIKEEEEEEEEEEESTKDKSLKIISKKVIRRKYEIGELVEEITEEYKGI